MTTTKPVAIPLRFGSRRFGKVVGGVLDSDGKTYPQPTCAEIWDGGQTFLVQPPWTDPLVEVHGMRPNALLSGGRQDVYGKPIDGWLFADQVNSAVWLIKPDLAGATSDLTGTLSIEFEIVRFGIFNPGGDAGYPPTSVTKTLADWGQGPEPPGPNCLPCDYVTWEADLRLVSAKTDGSTAIIMASIPVTDEYGYRWIFPWIHQWPVGFIGVTCTAAKGEKPTLALTVLRDRTAVFGSYTPFAEPAAMLADTICGGDVDYLYGSDENVAVAEDVILALAYVDDELVEITAAFESTLTNQADVPVATDDGYEQDSSGECIWKWTLSNGSDTTSWQFEQREVMHSEIDCDTKTLTYSLTREHVFGELTEEYTLEDGTVESATALEIASIGVGVGGPEVLGDLAYMAGYPFLSIYGEGAYFWWAFRRYAYGVIGLYCERYTGTEWVPQARGDCITPTGKILAAALGEGDYGAWNARTGEAVAGQTDPVGYV